MHVVAKSLRYYGDRTKHIQVANVEDNFKHYFRTAENFRVELQGLSEKYQKFFFSDGGSESWMTTLHTVASFMRMLVTWRDPRLLHHP